MSNSTEEEEKRKIELRIKSIDSKVSALERIADIWMSKHGSMNQGVFDQIQKLMDEREALHQLYLSFEYEEKYVRVY